MSRTGQACSTTGVNICPRCGLETQLGVVACPHDGTRIITTPSPGSLIFGMYRFISVIAAGGMGVVYKCLNTMLDKEVAVKTLLDEHFTAEQVLRFQREARAAGALNHRNLISIIDFGITRDGDPFMVMELLRGRTLSELLEEKRQFSRNEVIEIVCQICDGLEFAHGRGVVHRDLKPSNLMLAEEGGFVVKVLDFGIAKVAHEGGQALTRAGQIFGSPLYMSPEQGRGAPAGAPSDVYSLGCVLFELLTGAPPFRGEHALETIGMHQNSPPPTLAETAADADFPEALEDLCAGMLAKDPDKRICNFAEIRQILQSCQSEDLLPVYTKDEMLSDFSVPVVNLSTVPPQDKVKNRKRRLLITGIVGLFAVVGTYKLLEPYVPTILQEAFHVKDPVTEAAPAPTRLTDNVLENREEGSYESVTSNVESQQTEITVIPEQTENSDSVFAVLAKDKRLRKLTLEEMNDVTAAHLSMLSTLPIDDLNLSGTDVDDAGLDVLSKFKYLDVLDIGSCSNITAAGIRRLKHCKRLHHLSIGFRPETKCVIASLAELPSLRWLRLRASASATRVGGSSFTGSKFMIKKENLLSDDDLLALGKLKQIESIDLTEQKYISDRGIVALSRMPKLEALYLSATGITRNSFTVFSKFPKLKHVTLFSMLNVNRADLEAFKNRARLEVSIDRED